MISVRFGWWCEFEIVRGRQARIRIEKEHR